MPEADVGRKAESQNKLSTCEGCDTRPVPKRIAEVPTIRRAVLDDAAGIVAVLGVVASERIY